MRLATFKGAKERGIVDGDDIVDIGIGDSTVFST
jgi:hypothetical protein